MPGIITSGLKKHARLDLGSERANGRNLCHSCKCMHWYNYDTDSAHRRVESCCGAFHGKEESDADVLQSRASRRRGMNPHTEEGNGSSHSTPSHSSSPFKDQDKRISSVSGLIKFTTSYHVYPCAGLRASGPPTRCVRRQRKHHRDDYDGRNECLSSFPR